MFRAFSFGIRIAAACALSAWAAASAAPPSGLQRLDAIAAEARDLRDFLSRPELIDRYYRAWTDYAGADRFPRASYDAVLAQLRMALETAPELAERLWRAPPQPGSYQVKALATARGTRWDLSKWEERRDRLLEELRKSASGVQSDKDARDELARALSRAEAHAAELERAGRGKVARAQATNRFFAQLKAEPRVQAAAAFLALRKLEAPEVAAALDSPYPERALLALSRARKDVGDPATRPFVQDFIPDPRRLLSDPGLLDEKALKAGGFAKIEEKIWDFVSPPRVFHGIFRGIPMNVCIGGSCYNLSALRPEMWALPAIHEVDLRFTEVGGRMVGYTQQVPFEVDGKTFASLDANVPDFALRVVTQGSDGRLHSGSLFEAWYSEAYPRLPHQWSGMVFSNSALTVPQEIRAAIRASGPAAASTAAFERPAELFSGDPLERKLGTLLPKTQGTVDQLITEGLAHEAAVEDARRLVALGKPGTHGPAEYQSPRFLKRALEDHSPDGLVLQTRIFEAFAEQDPESPQATRLLKAAARKRLQEIEDLQTAAELSEFSATGSDHTYYALLRLTAPENPSPKWILNLPSEHPGLYSFSAAAETAAHRFRMDIARSPAGAALTAKQLRGIAHASGSRVVLEGLFPTMLKRTASAREFIDIVLSVKLDDPSSGDRFARAIGARLPHFFSMKPAPEEVTELVDAVHAAPEWVRAEIARRSERGARSLSGSASCVGRNLPGI